MKYLLDKTVVSDFTRGLPSVLNRLKATPKDSAAVSTVTAMEVEYGLRLNPARARKLIRALMQDLRMLPYEREDANATAAVRAALLSDRMT